MWYLIVSIPDLCTLTYFHLLKLIQISCTTGTQLLVFVSKPVKILFYTVSEHTIRGLTKNNVLVATSCFALCALRDTVYLTL